MIEHTALLLDGSKLSVRGRQVIATFSGLSLALTDGFAPTDVLRLAALGATVAAT
jgi:hypothetical protein